MKRHALLMSLMVAATCIQWSHQQIPLSMFEKLSNITGAVDLIDNLLMKNDEDGATDPMFTGAGAIDPIVRDIVAGSVVPPDTCTPKETSVEIPADNDPNVIFFPNCVAMRQCGGCGCGHGMLECAPVLVRVKEMQVMKMRYPFPGATKFTFEGLVTAPMQEHLNCACRCRVQPHHCHPIKHLYVEHSCRCQCRNEREALSCPSNKIWSNEKCGCTCPKLLWCMEDEYFSNSSCRCEERTDYVKIVDEQESVPAAGSSSRPCVGVSCRSGYRPVAIDDFCECRISTMAQVQVQSGSISAGQRQPAVSQQSPSDWERVPGRPQFHLDVHTTRTPTDEAARQPPPRRTRPRRPRPGNRVPIWQTGVMVPGAK